jgi:hypothetical protein
MWLLGESGISSAMADNDLVSYRILRMLGNVCIPICKHRIRHEKDPETINILTKLEGTKVCLHNCTNQKSNEENDAECGVLGLLILLPGSWEC